MLKSGYKRTKDLDIAYMLPNRAAMEEQTPFKSRLLLWSIFTFLSIIIGWAYLAEVDEIARGEGKVIPSQQLQVIQNLEGGIISDMLVSEGQLVNKGDVLVKIDDTQFQSSFQETKLRYFELQARAARLTAESQGHDSIALPYDIPEDAMSFVQQERGLFLKRQNQLNAQKATILKQVSQTRAELAQIEAEKKQTSRSLKLAEKELNILIPLAESGAVSEVEIIRAEKEVVRLETQISSLNLSTPVLNAQIGELESKLSELSLKHQSEAYSELSEVTAELSRLSQSEDALEDKVTRTAVRSPVKGTIKQIMVNTVGGVLQPGMDILSIVPIEDSLLIEAKVRPADIARIYPGQPAIVKFTAYDFAIYGGLEGSVVHISADSITNEKDESYYLVRVKTDRSFLGEDSQELPIIPGMTTNVDILTGKKTIMDYLLKPIFKAKERALTEK
ncbi:HlyD family type I secretion periplasmic adaptor subunit [Litoribrevibacter albus]|uniref:Membrane fusion protein (MFP) family protein n=1 Tax=Litoribrevibacter albus TaxID=1473156 RepID=A0AA37S9H0_9GAMM|nr:HlyD family type I secretion periplasmic adaptor subunit [Litoribrevibacter albus]GLQ30676.1 HlyD family type I secretion periplasmic adaptor subunit [Litoribrevibacter albus]